MSGRAAQAQQSAVPIAMPVTPTPRSADLAELSSTPLFISAAMESSIMPECRPRFFRSKRLASTADCTLPMPIWIVSPSRISREATTPTFSSVPEAVAAGKARSGSSISTNASQSSVRNPGSPAICGMP